MLGEMLTELRGCVQVIQHIDAFGDLSGARID
jgi:hypothetical protein